ncbi:FlhC family transcriptional regulator [Sphaerotilus sp.]|uniref:FlhC family transcriptional regulator n=1 Tax=Sphaerotilus sp. TaxID=2093942 RepID=UPI002ACE9672|nr:FlhC family transcriptional regulator [Sphaerotilus sp.]MDZ7855924.1 FlhC family transcriptional regulator [Sphaerotilus sp.]
MRTARSNAAAERHIRALELARDCVQLGARTRTVEVLTGLSASQINRLFHGHPRPSQRGRPPDSREWYYTTDLPNRIQSCMLVSIYRRLCKVGIDPARALVQGYAHYVAACKGRPRLNMDRAFDLVSHFDGRWVASQRSFSLATCPACASQFLTGLLASNGAAAECPFCKLLERFPRDPRIQDSFAAVEVGEPPEVLLPIGLVLRAMR